MHQLIKNLKENGAREKFLKEEEVGIVNQLFNLGLIFKFYKNKGVAYKFSNNVKVYRTKEGYNFELEPNRHMGVVFDYDDVFECVSDDKTSPDFYCLTYKLNPTEEDVKNFKLGDSVRVKVVARGYDIGNEGLLVKLPRSEENYFAMEKAPYITIGLANGAKSKNTSSLDFNEQISGTFIEGRKALIIKGKVYYNVRDIDVVSEIYSLKNGKDIIERQNGKKLISR